MRRVLLIFLALMFILPAKSGWLFDTNYKAKIKVKIINNLVLVPLRINGSNPLYFILDSGVKNLIISELFRDDLITFDYAKTIYLNGLGDGEPIETYHSPYNTISVDDLLVDGVDIFLIKNDIFSLSKHLGTKVNGMIGYDFFKDHVVEIDYDNNEVIVYDPEVYERESETVIPLVIEKNKPYIFAGVKIGESDKEIESKFLVDSGGSMALWLSAINNDKIYIPNKNIDSYLGKGLNGELHGKLSRISSINIGGYTHSKVLTAFPDSNSVEAAYLADHRVGSICGEILRRYTVTFNYPKLEMYLEQNSDFDDDFLFNNLGIEVYQPISGLNVYMISYIREGSIAESSGLKVDDRILSIDGYDLFKYNIKEIHGIIYELDDEDVEIEVKRDGKNIYFDFELGEGI